MSRTVEKPLQMWLTKDDNKHIAENLSVDFRRVIGIVSSCLAPSVQEIAEVVGITTARVEQIIAEVKQCEIQEIRDMLDSGLPFGAYTKLQYNGRSLVCKKCKQPIRAVPCGRCSIQIENAYCQANNVVEQTKETKSLPEPRIATHYPPGTRNKIRIMRWRAANGLSVFCGRDRTQDRPYVLPTRNRRNAPARNY